MSTFSHLLSTAPTSTSALSLWICTMLHLEPSEHAAFFEAVLGHHHESLDDQDSQEFHDEMDEYMPGDRREWLAYFLASNLLADVTDKQGRPLIEHCLRVFHSCCHLSPDQRLAALLHDCVEDGKLQKTGWTRNGVEQVIGLLFGDDVADLVVILSRPSGKSYREYIEFIASCPDVLLIKLADLRDNLDPTRGPIPDSLRQRYEEAVKILEAAQERYDSLNVLTKTVKVFGTSDIGGLDSFAINGELFQAVHPFSGVYIGDCTPEQSKPPELNLQTLTPTIYEQRSMAVPPDQLPEPMCRCAVSLVMADDLQSSSTLSSTLITEQEAALDSYSLSSLAELEPSPNTDLDFDPNYSAECDMVWIGYEFKEVG